MKIEKLTFGELIAKLIDKKIRHRHATDYHALRQLEQEIVILTVALDKCDPRKG